MLGIKLFTKQAVPALEELRLKCGLVGGQMVTNVI